MTDLRLPDSVARTEPPPQAAAARTGDASPPAVHATVDFLMRRMRHKSDFPALSARVARIQGLVCSEADHLQRLTEEILKDVSLTQRLLRLVNSVHYQRAGSGVGTVSRAVALVGHAGIRSLAMSAVLMEHMADQPRADKLKAAVMQAVLAGQLAHALHAGDHALQRRQAEEAFLGAMFFNLGPLLVECYLPEEADAVRMRQLELQAEAGGTLDADALRTLNEQAAQQVLGLSWDDLGQSVARRWGLPDGLLLQMRRAVGPPPARLLAQPQERSLWMTRMANEAAAAMVGPALASRLSAPMAGRCPTRPPWGSSKVAEPHWLESAEAWSEALRQAEQRYALPLALPPHALLQAGQEAWRGLAPMAAEFGRPGLMRSPGLQAGQPLALPGGAAVGSGSGSGAGDPADTPRREPALHLLQAGVRDLAEAAQAGPAQARQALQMWMETVWRAWSCDRVWLALKTPGRSELRGRLALGEGAEALCGQLIVRLPEPGGAAADVVAVASLRADESVLEDLADPRLAAALPAWLRSIAPHGACLLQPMRRQDSTLALLIAQRDRPFGLDAPERQALRQLREAVLRLLDPNVGR